MTYDYKESYDSIYGEVRETASENFVISRFEHSEHMNIGSVGGGYDLVFVSNRKELIELKTLLTAVISASATLGVQS